MPHRRDFLAWTSAALGLGCTSLIAKASAAEPMSATLPGLNPPPAPSGSHIGNLYPLIKQLAPGPDFPLSYLRDEFQNLGAWKQKARARLQELLYYAPPPCDPKPEVVERVDRGDYFQEKVYFNSTSVFRVPAYVLIPKHAKLPAPAIVALHDHGGFYLWGKEKLVENDDEHPTLTEFKQVYYAQRPIAVELVKQGYVVIVIDMFYWGERRLVLDDDPADFRDRLRTITPERIKEYNQRSAAYEQLLGRTIYTEGITWAGIIFWDDVRTVDYLVTRPEVDPKRLGCVGLSVGGLRSTHLAVLDDRIKAAVSCGWMCSFPQQLYRHVRSTIGHTKLIPGLYRDMDYPDVAAIAMPAAHMVINGTRDGLFELSGVEAAFQKLAACYKKAGIGAKFRGVFYDGPHEFNAEMQRQSWAWLKQHLA